MSSLSPRIGRLHELSREILGSLIAPAAAPRGSAVIDPDRIDWRALAGDVSAHALSLLVSHRIEELGLLAFVPEDVQRNWRADTRHAELQAALQRRQAHAISAALAQNNVQHAFFKGFAYRDWLYRPGWTRLGADLDLLVPRGKTEIARTTLRELGFVQSAGTIDYRGFRPATAAEILATETRHYELAQFVRTFRLEGAPAWLLADDFTRRPPFTFEQLEFPVCHVVVDVHWALHFRFSREEPLADLNWTVTAQGATPRLSAGWAIFTSLFKLYFEAFDRPYYGFHHLADLAALLRAQPSARDWQLVDALVRRHGFFAAAFYTLSAAEELAAGARVPGGLLAEWSRTAPPLESFAPGQERTTYHTDLDLGDFLPYLIGQRLPRHFPLAATPTEDAGVLAEQISGTQPKGGME